MDLPHCMRRYSVVAYEGDLFRRGASMRQARPNMYPVPPARTVAGQECSQAGQIYLSAMLDVCIFCFERRVKSYC